MLCPVIRVSSSGLPMVSLHDLSDVLDPVCQGHLAQTISHIWSPFCILRYIHSSIQQLLTGPGLWSLVLPGVSQLFVPIIGARVLAIE